MSNEICLGGIVVSPPHYFYGSQTHAMHEAFTMRSDDGRALEVVDNIGLAPRCPVNPGDRITVKGEFVPDGSHGPMIHWTHHDPAHRHQDGYIELNGRQYG